MLTGEPLRVAVLTSRRAPGLEHLSARPGSGWRVAGVIATEPGSDALGTAEAARLPATVHDVRAFCASHGAALADRDARRDYDRLTLDILRLLDVDLVVLCGYLLIVTEPLLEAFEGRILNVHDSDLARLGSDGLPRYRGLRSTREAIAAGEPWTRSTVHLVTAEVDRGPLVTRSWPFPVPPLVEAARRWGAEDVLSAYAYAHRGWMMHAAWGRLLERALERMASGQVRVEGGRAVVAGRWGPEDLAPPGTWPDAAAAPWGTAIDEAGAEPLRALRGLA